MGNTVFIFHFPRLLQQATPWEISGDGPALSTFTNPAHKGLLKEAGAPTHSAGIEVNLLLFKGVEVEVLSCRYTKKRRQSPSGLDR